MQTGLVNVSVIACSNIAGRAEKSSDEVTLAARCRASGWRLLYLGRRSDPVTVRFSSEDLQHVDGDYFTVLSSQLFKYTADIFGPGVNVESFLTEGLRFRFIPETCRKVPVVAVSLFSFRPQYTQTSEIRLHPDSVLVYGPSEIISGITGINTRSIIRSDVKSNMHGETALESPSGLRLSEKSVRPIFR